MSPIKGTKTEGSQLAANSVVMAYTGESLDTLGIVDDVVTLLTH